MYIYILKLNKINNIIYYYYYYYYYNYYYLNKNQINNTDKI